MLTMCHTGAQSFANSMIRFDIVVPTLQTRKLGYRIIK